MSERFDIIVIGSGPGGYKAAVNAALTGARVALVEKGLWGGTCLNQGCVPKDSLVHLASLMEDIEGLQGHGIEGSIKGDFASAMAHKDNVVAGIRKDFPVWLRHLGVHMVHGTARFIDRHTLEVSDHSGGEPTTLTADKFIIATGAHPKPHPHCPTDGKRIIDSSHFMFDLKEAPESILFVGGGPISAELGFFLHQYGTRVTIAEHKEALFNRRYIPDRASNLLEAKFRRLGIQVKKRVTVTGCQVHDDKVSVHFSDGSKEEFATVFAAIGRTPATDGLGLEQAGVQVNERGFIITNEYLETTAPGIYAIGDVKPGPMTANGALHDAKIAVANALSNEKLNPNYHSVPIVIKSALNIAAVGLTEDEAEDAGFEPDVARVNFRGSAKARASHDMEGYIEVVHDEETGQLLGGCIVGPEAGEQIHMLTAACQSDRGLWFFTDMNYSHPSWTEELETAIGPFTAAFNKAGVDVFQPGIYARRQENKHKP